MYPTVKARFNVNLNWILWSPRDHNNSLTFCQMYKVKKGYYAHLLVISQNSHSNDTVIIKFPKFQISDEIVGKERRSLLLRDTNKDVRLYTMLYGCRYQGVRTRKISWKISTVCQRTCNNFNSPWRIRPSGKPPLSPRSITWYKRRKI